MPQHLRELKATGSISPWFQRFHGRVKTASWDVHAIRIFDPSLVSKRPALYAIWQTSWKRWRMVHLLLFEVIGYFTYYTFGLHICMCIYIYIRICIYIILDIHIIYLCVNIYYISNIIHCKVNYIFCVADITSNMILQW